MKTSSPRKTKSDEDVGVVESCGNVFEDLGLPQPDIALLKATLVQRIRKAIQVRKLSDPQAALLLEIKTSQIQPLIEGRVHRYSLDRLFYFLNRLGLNVEVVVNPTSHGEATSRVVSRAE